MTLKLDAFTRQYLETALWSSTDDSNDEGEPLDENYGTGDIADESLQKMIADCKKFQEDNSELLELFDLEDCGHDFWLTRNGHGAGFWDGEYPEPQATQLTEACKAFGECNLSPAASGKLYLYDG